MLLLLSCTPEKIENPPATDSPTTCPDTLGEIRVTGDLIPGTTLTVSVTSGLIPVFSASAGTLTPTPTGADWQLPDSLATHTAETLTLSATWQSPDCPPLTATTEPEIDWPIGRRAVVLYNPNIEGSQEVAETYADFRGVSDLCPIPTPSSDILPSTELGPFWDTLSTCIHDHTHYLVPVYGVPYKIEGQIKDISGSGLYTTTSLDALLVSGSKGQDLHSADYSLLYQEGNSTAQSYAPYIPFGEWKTDHRSEFYLVARIDGADPAAALDLIARTELAEATEPTGTVYVDGNRGDIPPTTDEFGSYEAGEWNMWGTRMVFDEAGRWPVVWDGHAEEFGTDPAPLSCPDALYYAGWYSFYNYNDVFTWAPGAIGGHLDSCSACDIRDPGTWSGGALSRGITATFGAVNEPYVAGMPEYDQFFLYLLQGASFGEAAYESTMLVSWMMVWVGDPLYRPFPAQD